MATYLIRRTNEEDRNANGIGAVIASASSEANARTLAATAAPGGTRIPATWSATQLAASDLPGALNPTFFEGDAVAPGERFRGS